MSRTLSSCTLLTAVAVLPITASAQSVQSAPSATAVAATPSEDLGSDIVVTGSRGLQRTVTDSATPIDVIQSQELVRTGRTGVLQALNALVPSFNTPSRSGGMAGTIISTGGLRGLNPDQTLILVDGKRRHKTSLIMAGSSSFNGAVPADLDLIAVSAIDHIEVLRDGAAAKYGSDAIAGVINIILKKDSEISGSFLGGQNINRHDGQLYQFETHIGRKLGDRGFFDISVQGKEQDQSNRAMPVSPSLNLYNLVGGARDPREATIDRLVTQNYGALPQKTLNFGYNSEYEVGTAKLYSFGTFSLRKSDLLGTFRAPNNPISLPEVYPNGFRPDVVIREEDYEFALGVRGTLAGWDYDASTTYGMNLAKLRVDNTINASLGPTSPTEFYLGSYRSTEWVNSLDLTRGFDVGGNLQVSAGLQHRLESYTISPGDVLSSTAGTYVIPAGQGNAGAHPAPGSQGVSGITTTDAGSQHRNNLSAYVDVAYDPTPRLTLDVASRFEHFDDASGNTVNGEVSGRYAFTHWLALRGAISTGFRAPSIAQAIYSSTSGQFLLVNGQTALTLIKILPVDSPAAIALGAQPLRPEKSTDYSAGIVLTPAPTLNITVDAYQIDVKDRIVVTGTLGGAAVSAILVANNLPTGISAQYFTNAIDTRTRGIDVVSTYRLELGKFGQMRLNAAFNYNDTSIRHIIANPVQLSSLGQGYVLFDRLTQQNIEVLLPKTKIYLGDVWTRGKVSLSLRETRYGSYTIPQLVAANDRRFGEKWITDAEIGWSINRHIDLAVGANNLFNVYPDANGIINASLGAQQFGASPPSPFGFTGGFYYARVSVRL